MITLHESGNMMADLGLEPSVSCRYGTSPAVIVIAMSSRNMAVLIRCCHPLAEGMWSRQH